MLEFWNRLKHFCISSRQAKCIWLPSHSRSKTDRQIRSRGHIPRIYDLRFWIIVTDRSCQMPTHATIIIPVGVMVAIFFIRRYSLELWTTNVEVERTWRSKSCYLELVLRQLTSRSSWEGISRLDFVPVSSTLTGVPNYYKAGSINVSTVFRLISSPCRYCNRRCSLSYVQLCLWYALPAWHRRLGLTLKVLPITGFIWRLFSLFFLCSLNILKFCQ